MVMLCSDIFPKGVDTPQFCFPRHRNAKPCVFQIGIKIQQIGALGKKQELMLWIFTDLCKYLVSPFRLPSGEIAHAGKKKVLRTFLFHHLELTRKELRISEGTQGRSEIRRYPNMAEEKKVVTLDDFEQRLMVSGLMDFRNDLLRDEKPTEDINDLILKVIDAPTKKEKRRADREAR